MNKKCYEILQNYHTLGKFPTDKEMQLLITTNDDWDDIFDVELALLDDAASDISHPYHLMTIPKDVGGTYPFSDHVIKRLSF
jgi:hypothetical protein